MSDDRLDIQWRSPGPVSTAFMHADNEVEILNGPVGAGKTRTVFVKTIRRAQKQRVSMRDGMTRKFKLCVVHANYRQLWRSTIKSWWKLMPKNAGDWTGAVDGPATHNIRFGLADSTVVDYTVDFIAVGDNAAEDVMRGYEPTAFYLNECDLLAHEVFEYARGRAGRYPDMDEGGPTWYGIVADANAPQLNSWLYKEIFKKRPSFCSLFRQPSALSPYAENIPGLPPGYYARQQEGQSEAYIARMIENKPGYSNAGRPVYGKLFVDSDDQRSHVARASLAPVPGIPLQIGLDAGGHPAAVFGQRMPNGQWRILRELWGEQGTGGTRFGKMVAKTLKDHFEGWRDIRGWADPSAAYGADKDEGEFNWIQMVAHNAGIRVDAAPTNALETRLEAVRVPLGKFIDAQPAVLISFECEMLREGFNSGYRYRKIQSSEGDKFGDEPDKSHPYSDLHDALQYLFLGGGEDVEIRGRQAAMSGAGTRAQNVNDWNPFG